MRRTALVLIVIGVCCALGSSAEVARGAPPAAVLGVTRGTLERLDPRTLRPLEDARPLKLGARPESTALSPSGTKAALAFSKSVWIVNTRTLRVIERLKTHADASRGLYWLGTSHVSLLVAAGWSGIGFEYTALGQLQAPLDTTSPVEAVLPVGVVLAYPDGNVEAYGLDDNDCALHDPPRYDISAPYAVTTDTRTERIFAISQTGTVAEIGGIFPGPPGLNFRQARLTGRPFAAGWMGHNRIALWGQDGLGYIDLFDMTVHPIAADATSALPTPYGVVGWNPNSATGLALYRTDGTLSFRTLGGQTVTSIQLLGAHVYARAGGRRFSVDLRNGSLTGPLATSATLISPSLVAMP